jgi:molybdopterin adenylyltransferase
MLLRRCYGIRGAEASRFPLRLKPVMRVSILTVSDSVSSGKAEDRSGPAVAMRSKELGWEIVSSTILPDERTSIEAFLKETADSQAADVILTTGGTGFGPRDVTPEATITVAERLAPGFAEHMRAEGQKKTKWAILSRGTAAIRGQSIIVNLPGSPKGAVESLDAIAELLPHAVAVLHGARHD